MAEAVGDMGNLLVVREQAELIAYREDPYRSAAAALERLHRSGDYLGKMVLRPSDVHQMVDDLRAMAHMEASIAEHRLWGLV